MERRNNRNKLGTRTINKLLELELFELAMWLLEPNNIALFCDSLPEVSSKQKIIIQDAKCIVDPLIVKTQLIAYAQLPDFKTKKFNLRKSCEAIVNWYNALAMYLNELRRKTVSPHGEARLKKLSNETIDYMEDNWLDSNFSIDHMGMDES